MAEIIQDGTGRNFRARVTADNRITMQAVNEPISSERSRKGKLFGVGTGGLTLPASYSGPVLWFRNDDSDNDMFVQKLIFGWNGGDPGGDLTVFSLINYQTSVPTSASTAISFQNENIKFAAGGSPNTLAKATAYKWDQSGSTGLGGTTGGFAQIPNRLIKGNTSIPIDGEIILGNGDTMRFDITPENSSSGIFQVSVVAYLAPPGGIAEET